MHRKKTLGILMVWLTVAGAMPGCKKSQTPAQEVTQPQSATQSPAPVEAAPPVTVDRAMLQAFGPLPAADLSLPPAKVALGRMLYHETALSLAQDISCDTCHPLAQYGADHKAVSEGHKKQKGDRNAPTVYNAFGHIAQFWDGRAKDVEAQALGPILNPKEMAMPSDAEVVKRLRANPQYVDAFAKAFPDAGGGTKAITYAHVGEAIGAFERTLVTPSRWDRYLQGDDQALTDAQKKGFQTFVQTGCVICHTGTYVGGSMYQKAGLVQPWPSQHDQGRFNVTHQETDKMVFKVPSLRNVAETAPYFHDGSVAKLDEAIRLMGRHQLGKELTAEEIASIAEFLTSLTGALPAQDQINKPVSNAK